MTGVLVGQGYFFFKAVPVDTLIQIACHDGSIFGDEAAKMPVPVSR